MAFRFAAGAKVNHLARVPAAQIGSSPAGDAFFGASFLGDQRCDAPFRFSSIAADSYVNVDLNLVTNGDAELGNATGWTSNGGTLTADAVTKNNGTYGLKLTNGAAGEYYQDVTVRAGEAMKLEWALFGGGGAIAAAIRLQNRQTGKYLQPGGTWSTAIDIDSQTTAAWKPGGAGTSTLQFTVESFATCMKDQVTLRLAIRLSASGTVYFDDISLYPATDFCGVFGHNIDAVLAPELRSGISGATLESSFSFAVRQPLFFAVASSPIYQRYLRLKLTGTPVVQTWIGEWLLGQLSSFQRNSSGPAKIAYARRQVRYEMRSGMLVAAAIGPEPVRTVTLPFQHELLAQWQQLRDELFRRASGGVFPALIVPTEAESELCFFGTLQGDMQASLVVERQYDTDVSITEYPFPVTT